MRFTLFFSLIVLLSSCSQNNEAFVYQTKNNGVTSVYLMDRSHNPHLISQPEFKAATPALSPTLDHIAYLSEDNGNWDIWIYNIETKENTNITQSAEIDGTPSWSPDGKQLAFMSVKNGNRDIFIYDLQKKTTHQSTFHPTIDLDPIWSEYQPNNLYFKTIRDGYEAIYQLNITDSLSGMVSALGGNNAKAETVPSQNKISYVRFYEGKYTLMIFDETTRTTQPILVSDIPIEACAWSSKGDHFALDLDGKVSIYIYGQDKATFKETIPNAEFPSWSHSGLTLFYNLNDEKGAQVFKYNLLDDAVTPLTTESINAFYPIPLD